MHYQICIISELKVNGIQPMLVKLISIPANVNVL